LRPSCSRAHTSPTSSSGQPRASAAALRCSPLAYARRDSLQHYVVDLPAEFGVSTSFNVADLKLYEGEDEELLSRMTSVQEGEDDEDISTDTGTSTPAAPSTSSSTETLQAPPLGPITRARARELNFVLLLKNNGPQSSFCT
jgi:hypothetical protein